MAAQRPSFARSPTAGQTGRSSFVPDTDDQGYRWKPNQGNANLLKKVAAARVAKANLKTKKGPAKLPLQDKPQYLVGSPR